MSTIGGLPPTGAGPRPAAAGTPPDPPSGSSLISTFAPSDAAGLDNALQKLFPAMAPTGTPFAFIDKPTGVLHNAAMFAAEAQGFAAGMKAAGATPADIKAQAAARFALHFAASINAPPAIGQALSQVASLHAQGSNNIRAMVPVLDALSSAPPVVIAATLDRLGGASEDDITKHLAILAAMPADRQREITDNLMAKIKEPAALVASMPAVEGGYAAWHQQEVGRIAADFAQKMGMSPADIATLKEAGGCYDLGKTVVEQQRPGLLGADRKLTNEEFDFMKTHVDTDVLKPLLDEVHASPGARQIAYGHHLRYDGGDRGYPKALSGEASALFGGQTTVAGENIPPLVRLMSIVDGFHAMTEKAANFNRPDVAKMPVEKALSIIESEAGKQYDPVLSKQFIDYMRAQQPPAPEQTPTPAAS